MKLELIRDIQTVPQTYYTDIRILDLFRKFQFDHQTPFTLKEHYDNPYYYKLPGML